VVTIPEDVYNMIYNQADPEIKALLDNSGTETGNTSSVQGAASTPNTSKVSHAESKPEPITQAQFLLQFISNTTHNNTTHNNMTNNNTTHNNTANNNTTHSITTNNTTNVSEAPTKSFTSTKLYTRFKEGN